MKNYILISLFLIISITAFSQSRKVSQVKVDDNITRYFINYENGLPTLTTNKYGSLKFYLEKYVEIVADKKVERYNILFNFDEDLIKSLNKDIFVTVVFTDYSIINARPSLEKEGAVKGTITMPIRNIDRIASTSIKTIIFKNKDESDDNDIVFKFSKDDQGNQKFKSDALLLKNAK
jgi:hypothetical protein